MRILHVQNRQRSLKPKDIPGAVIVNERALEIKVDGGETNLRQGSFGTLRKYTMKRQVFPIGMIITKRIFSSAAL